MKVQMWVNVPIRIWRCHDCKTVSDIATSNSFHVGCVGETHKIKKENFVKMREPRVSRSGEIIWVLKEEFVGSAPF